MKQLTKLLPLLLLWMMSSCGNVKLPGTTTTSSSSTNTASSKNSINKSSLKTLGIPAGHLPAPGECRTWHPDRPAGQQPPPRKCSGKFPSTGGVWLIERTSAKEVKIHFFDAAKDVRTYRVD